MFQTYQLGQLTQEKTQNKNNNNNDSSNNFTKIQPLITIPIILYCWFKNLALIFRYQFIFIEKIQVLLNQVAILKTDYH